ncbi:hypothetical protein BDZ97DRAFT_1615995, partial [Flammula alnicola]
PNWENIPQYEHRAWCNVCETIETLEHIQTECKASGQEVIWKLAKEILEERGVDTGHLSYGDTLGCALANFRKENGKPNTALNRLYTIIISESLYLIWLIRCEWKIESDGDVNKIAHKNEITSRWRHRINRRLKIDQAMATKTAYKWKKITKSLVMRTWKGTLQNEELLPEDWTRVSGVLVG